MTISKITASVTPIEEAEKINEIIAETNLKAIDSTVVHLTGNETISGSKTFSSSPQVPTAASGDSSTKAASTEFVTTADSNLQTQINTKANSSDVVNLTGTQTITGEKTFTNKVEIQSANGHILFHIPGTMYTRLQESSNGLEVRTGDGVSLAPLFAGDSDINHSIVTTVNKSKAANGYFKLGNGLIIQWGWHSNSGSTLTFPTPFTSTNYSVTANYRKQSSSGSGIGHVNFYPTSTTSCYFNSQGGDFQWIAIGY